MEGRQSRASSRYGSVQAAPVFTGTVRRWKKQWVSCSQAPPAKRNGRKKRASGGNNPDSGGNDAPALMLCRWTPLSPPSEEEPRRRRCRYAPVVPIRKTNTEGLVKATKESRTIIKEDDHSESSEANTRIDGDDLVENSNTEDSSPEENFV